MGAPMVPSPTNPILVIVTPFLAPSGERCHWIAEDRLVWDYAEARSVRQLDVTPFDADPAIRVVVSVDVWLGEPYALIQAGMHGRAQMRARGGDDVAAPGVIAAVRQRPCLADVAEGRHGVQPADPGDFHAEPVAQAFADDTQDRGKVLDGLIEVDRVVHPGADGLYLFDGVARLLQDEGDLGALAAEA